MAVKPTESELEILQILWQQGPSSVREVNEILNRKRETGYTTTLKIMQIMTDKGILVRDTSIKTHIYKPLIPESDTKNRLLHDFINNTFYGSALKMVMQVLGNSKASPAELEALKQYIENLEKQEQK